jgi:hypothetical protein
MVNVNFFLFISVQPRLNDDIPSSDEVIHLQIGMSVNLTVNLLSNPTPTTQWIFRRKDFIDQTLQPHSNSNGYKYTSTIYIQTINSTQYGSYIVSATNDIGNFSTTFSVIQPGRYYLYMYCFICVSSCYQFCRCGFFVLLYNYFNTIRDD